MEWNPPVKHGWDVEPLKPLISNGFGSKRKSRYDDDTFSRGKSSYSPLIKKHHSPLGSNHSHLGLGSNHSPLGLGSNHSPRVTSLGSKVAKSQDKKQDTGRFLLKSIVGYCHISGLVKPIKISIFTSFLLKSGVLACLFDESSSVIMSVNVYI
jgi:hypothetical protein